MVSKIVNPTPDDVTLAPGAAGLLRRFGPLTDFYRRFYGGLVRDHNYVVRFGTVTAAGGTASSTLTFNTAGFLWLTIYGESDGVNQTLIRIVDAKANDPVTNTYVCLANLCGGRSAIPKVLPAPRAVKVGTRFTIDIINEGSLDLDFVEIVLGGVWLT